jgi:hypothetical protein
MPILTYFKVEWHVHSVYTKGSEIYPRHSFLGAFAKLRKATISSVMFVCLSVCCPSACNNSAPTERIFFKFEDFSKIFPENSSFIKI